MNRERRSCPRINRCHVEKSGVHVTLVPKFQISRPGMENQAWKETVAVLERIDKLRMQAKEPS
jgi:hypothetical protein